MPNLNLARPAEVQIPVAPPQKSLVLGLLPWALALVTVLAFTWALSQVSSATVTICRHDGGCKVWTLGVDR